jgi:hypothetical protein
VQVTTPLHEHALDVTCRDGFPLPEHRPLGHVNRSRKHAYEASKQMRGAAAEPTQVP